MNAEPMVRRCFRLQNPDLFGREPIDEPMLLTQVPRDADYVLASPLIPEESMGNGEAFA